MYAWFKEQKAANRITNITERAIRNSQVLIQKQIRTSSKQHSRRNMSLMADENNWRNWERFIYVLKITREKNGSRVELEYVWNIWYKLEYLAKWARAIGTNNHETEKRTKKKKRRAWLFLGSSPDILVTLWVNSNLQRKNKSEYSQRAIAYYFWSTLFCRFWQWLVMLGIILGWGLLLEYIFAIQVIASCLSILGLLYLLSCNRRWRLLLYILLIAIMP